MRAAFALNHLRFERSVYQAKSPGYSLQVLGLLRSSASLWAFRFYPCPSPIIEK
jgi:hypothetical protein